MVLRETRSDRDHEVYLLFKYYDSYVSLQNFTITLPHTNNFMYKDFLKKLAEKDPQLTHKERFRMYIRYGRCKFFPIFDYFTMVGALRMMEDLRINPFYIIRLDDVYWSSTTTRNVPPKFDPMLIYAYYPDFVLIPDMSQVKPAHEPEENQPLREKFLPKSLEKIEAEMMAASTAGKTGKAT